ncbi:MarR family transcriptional regulator [Microbacterium sp.]|uniref:MarR family winged helix-turn-helix transcriptional regulator n=1 Tax=Microbacterium sp. TaxID=51671 RepID=UPI002810D1AA|nr:MarR family transcriptional regulator [Microbacterium sp.]
MAKRNAPGQERVVLHDPVTMDPDEEIVRRSHLSDDELAGVIRVLDAMQRWRETERRMSEASRRYMKLGDTDMRALRLLIAAQRQGMVVTPGFIAGHLGISTASTTKLLDRLEAGRHITRTPHPSDRRSLAIEVTEETRRVARESVGRAHALRFDVVAALTDQERRTVADFFDAMTATAVPEARGSAESPGTTDGSVH